MPAQLTITDVIATYMRHAQGYYVKGGKPTSEVHAIKLALSFVERLFGSSPAVEFSPRKLKEVRDAMIAHEITRRRKVTDEKGNVAWEIHVVRKGLARKCVNKLIGRVRRMFAWAVEEEMLPVEVHNAILRVKGLKRGKSQARETGRVKPVPDEHIAGIDVPRTVRAMIDVQKLAGCRPQDVVQLRQADIDMSGTVWEYRPRSYKTEHHNDDEREELERIVYLGPKCQSILKPFLTDDPSAYVFTTQRSASHYTVASYRQAIRRACLRAKVPIWAPNRLRHNRLTELRKTFGLEASRVCGGHREVATTQIYAEQDRDLAREVMEKVG